LKVLSDALQPRCQVWRLAGDAYSVDVARGLALAIRGRV
jgi:hypothetical protein